MNVEFIKDLIAACRADPERAKDLLFSNALADILERLLDRMLELEHQQAVERHLVMSRQTAQLTQQLAQQQLYELREAALLHARSRNEVLYGSLYDSGTKP